MRAQLRGLDHPFDPPVWDEPHQRHQQVDPENLLPEAQVSTAEEGPSIKALQPPSAAIPILNKAMMQMETEDGWVGLGAVGQRLANIASDFDPRTYGYRKLSDLVRRTGAFDIDQPEGRAMRIRAKPKPASRPRAKATAAR